jgi:hypothetical protein
VVSDGSVVELDEGQPAHRRPFAVDHALDDLGRRLLAVEPWQHCPGVEAVLRRLLAELSTPVLEQPRGHAALGEAPGKRSRFTAPPDHDAVVDRFEDDVVAGSEVGLFAQILRDHNLTFGAHLLSPTM